MTDEYIKMLEKDFEARIEVTHKTFTIEDLREAFVLGAEWANEIFTHTNCAYKEALVRY